MSRWLHFWRAVDMFVNGLVAVGFLISLLKGDWGFSLLLLTYLVWIAVKDLKNRPMKLYLTNQVSLGEQWEEIIEIVVKHLLDSGHKITLPRERNAKGQWKKDIVLKKKAE